MLSRENRQELKNLMQSSISGIVTKNNLKEWFLGLQKQDNYFCQSCNIKDLEELAAELKIKVVLTKAEYDKFKNKRKCFYSIPNLRENNDFNIGRKTNKTIILNVEAETIKKLYHNENRSADEICKMYGIGITKFYKYLRENNIKLKLDSTRNKGKVKEEDIPVCIALREKGMTYKAIAEKYGVTRQYMQERLKKTKTVWKMNKIDLLKENRELKMKIEELENKLNLKEAI